MATISSMKYSLVSGTFDGKFPRGQVIMDNFKIVDERLDRCLVRRQEPMKFCLI